MAATELNTRAQEITEKTISPLEEGSDKVRPYDKVKVYSTGKNKHSKEGTLLEVHPLLAKSLIDAGKATKDKPKTK